MIRGNRGGQDRGEGVGSALDNSARVGICF